MSQILARVYRGNLVESIHRGDWVLCDHQGQVLAYGGCPSKITYWRSAAKPIQALPVVEQGVAEHYGFSDDELAIMCSSHTGEDFHIATVKSLLGKISLPETAIKCGTSQLSCSCSGKHGGMLALCQYHGWDIDNYLQAEHPVQQLMLAQISRMCNINQQKIVLGVDGCGVPVFGLPLKDMALAYARLVKPVGLSDNLVAASNRIVQAMHSFPQMIAGPDQFCTDLMTSYSQIGLIAKSGVEGIYCLGLPETGLGLALKIEDGNKRAIPTIILAILAKLGYSGESNILGKYRPVYITNDHGHQVGKIVPDVIGEDGWNLCKSL